MFVLIILKNKGNRRHAELNTRDSSFAFLDNSIFARLITIFLQGLGSDWDKLTHNFGIVLKFEP